MQVVIILGGGWLATKLRTKGLVIAGIAMIAAVGTILLLTVSREQKGVLLFGYYLVRFYSSVLGWEVNNY